MSAQQFCFALLLAWSGIYAPTSQKNVIHRIPSMGVHSFAGFDRNEYLDDAAHLCFANPIPSMAMVEAASRREEQFVDW